MATNYACPTCKNGGTYDLNAVRLADAAPELLKACLSLVETVESWHPFPNVQIDKSMKLAEIAIAIAEGR